MFNLKLSNLWKRVINETKHQLTGEESTAFTKRPRKHLHIVFEEYGQTVMLLCVYRGGNTIAVTQMLIEPVNATDSGMLHPKGVKCTFRGFVHYINSFITSSGTGSGSESRIEGHIQQCSVDPKKRKSEHRKAGCFFSIHTLGWFVKVRLKVWR